MGSAIFLLPAAARFGAQRWQPDILRMLGRADATAAAAGRRAQLTRHFPLPEDGWPLAALSRQVDAGDADDAGSAWVRADPAWLRPDINGVRLMGHGDTLGVDQADVEALLPALRPVFGDAGFELDAPVPSRWYLRVPRGSRLPGFVDPADALGTDLSEFDDDSAEARRWRALGSEAQIVLHNHPRNALRAAAGRPPINALWFWGGGVLPIARAQPPGGGRSVFTGDASVQALAAVSAQVAPLPGAWQPPAAAGAAVFDLSALRDLRQLQVDWLRPAFAALAGGRMSSVTVDDEDGGCLVLRRWHRLRFWRRAWTPAPAAADEA